MRRLRLNISYTNCEFIFPITNNNIIALKLRWNYCQFMLYKNRLLKIILNLAGTQEFWEQNVWYYQMILPPNLCGLCKNFL